MKGIGGGLVRMYALNRRNGKKTQHDASLRIHVLSRETEWLNTTKMEGKKNIQRKNRQNK